METTIPKYCLHIKDLVAQLVKAELIYNGLTRDFANTVNSEGGSRRILSRVTERWTGQERVNETGQITQSLCTCLPCV